MKRTIDSRTIEAVLERVRAVEALIGRNDSPVDKIMEDLSGTPRDALSAADWDTLDEGHYAAHRLAQTVRELFTMQVTEATIKQEGTHVA